MIKATETEIVKTAPLKEPETCGTCMTKFPGHRPFEIMIPPGPEDRPKIIGSNKKQMVKTMPFIVCCNPKSPRCHQLLHIDGTCDQRIPIEEVDKN